DAAAKYRMSVQLRVGLMEAFTGSRTGFDSGGATIRPEPCQPLLEVGGNTLPSAGCDNGEFRAKAYWDPKKYFAWRDREWKQPHVTVGPLEETGKTGSAKDSSDMTRPEGASEQH